jgi:hypothetical protein
MVTRDNIEGKTRCINSKKIFTREINPAEVSEAFERRRERKSRLD